MATLLDDPPTPRSADTAPAQRLRTTMAAMRLAFTWFGTRKTLSPEQKARAAESFGAEGNYLSAGKDRAIAVAAVRQARRLTAARALQGYGPKEILPGPAVKSDEDLLRAIGNIATTIFHPVGTCRMGSDALAVVDDRLQVRGLRGVRVVDASIMPTITSGNTASPVIMIAEKAADTILAGSV